MAQVRHAHGDLDRARGEIDAVEAGHAKLQAVPRKEMHLPGAGSPSSRSGDGHMPKEREVERYAAEMADLRVPVDSGESFRA